MIVLDSNHYVEGCNDLDTLKLRAFQYKEELEREDIPLACRLDARYRYNNIKAYLEKHGYEIPEPHIKENANEQRINKIKRITSRKVRRAIKGS